MRVRRNDRLQAGPFGIGQTGVQSQLRTDIVPSIGVGQYR